MWALLPGIDALVLGVVLRRSPARTCTGAGNPDGMHRGWPGHAAVGAAVAAEVAALLAR